MTMGKNLGTNLLKRPRAIFAGVLVYCCVQVAVSVVGLSGGLFEGSAKTPFVLNLVLPVAIVAIAALMTSRRLELTGDVLRLRSPFGGFEQRLDDIGRLTLFRPSQKGTSGEYYIETRAGATRVFVAVERSHAALDEILREVEARTGLAWESPEAVERLSVGGFIEQFREAAALPDRKSFWTWVLGHLFFGYPGESGLSGPLFRGATRVLALSMLPLIVLAGFGDVLPSWLRMLLALLVWSSIMLFMGILMVLMRTQRRGKELLERELEVAREVQQRLLPSGSPRVEGLEVAGICIPAQSVGGDYFDFLSTHDGRFAAAVADVSGKGLHAGILMTLTKGVLSSALESSQSTLEAVAQVNRLLRASSQERMFVTMVLALCDAPKRRVEILRAGHNPPLLVSSDGTVRWIQPPGLALGMDRGPLFEGICRTEEVALEPGSVLVLYTDGVTEAMDPDSAEYGEERLERVVTANRAASVDTIRQALLDEVHTFRRGRAANDDLTVVVIKAA